MFIRQQAINRLGELDENIGWAGELLEMPLKEFKRLDSGCYPQEKPDSWYIPIDPFRRSSRGWGLWDIGA